MSEQEPRIVQNRRPGTADACTTHIKCWHHSSRLHSGSDWRCLAWAVRRHSRMPRSSLSHQPPGCWQSHQEHHQGRWPFTKQGCQSGHTFTGQSDSLLSSHTLIRCKTRSQEKLEENRVTSRKEPQSAGGKAKQGTRSHIKQPNEETTDRAEKPCTFQTCQRANIWNMKGTINDKTPANTSRQQTQELDRGSPQNT